MQFVPSHEKCTPLLHIKHFLVIQFHLSITRKNQSHAVTRVGMQGLIHTRRKMHIIHDRIPQPAGINGRGIRPTIYITKIADIQILLRKITLLFQPESRITDDKGAGIHSAAHRIFCFSADRQGAMHALKINLVAGITRIPEQNIICTTGDKLALLSGSNREYIQRPPVGNRNIGIYFNHFLISTGKVYRRRVLLPGSRTMIEHPWMTERRRRCPLLAVITLPARGWLVRLPCSAPPMTARKPCAAGCRPACMGTLTSHKPLQPAAWPPALQR